MCTQWQWTIRNMAIILVTLITRFVDGQYIGLGFCPRVHGMKNFNIAKYEGVWYEIERYFFLPQVTTYCHSSNVTANKDGTFYTVIINYEKLTQRKWTNPTLSRLVSHDQDRAKFVMEFTVTQSPLPFRIRFPWTMIDTEYESYSVHYSCTQLGLLNLQGLWIFARNRTLSSEKTKQIHQKLNGLGIDTNRLRPSDQHACLDA